MRITDGKNVHPPKTFNDVASVESAAPLGQAGSRVIRHEAEGQEPSWMGERLFSAGKMGENDSRQNGMGRNIQVALPIYEQNPPPEYPAMALRKGWEGVVKLKVSVSARGRVSALDIDSTSGHKVLDRAALRAVRRWRFVPARSIGIPVASRVLVPIEFRLPNVDGN